MEQAQLMTIGGRDVPGAGSLPVINPATGQAFATAPDCSRAQLDEASKLRAEAEALKAEYEAKIVAAAKEADDMRARAEEEAGHIMDQAKEDATALIARRQKMAEEKIAAAERAAISQVRAKAAQAATAAAAALIAEHHDADADKTLVDGTIKGLGSLN